MSPRLSAAAGSEIPARYVSRISRTSDVCVLAINRAAFARFAVSASCRDNSIWMRSTIEGYGIRYGFDQRGGRRGRMRGGRETYVSGLIGK